MDGMKDSGYKFIGTIPKEWQTQRLNSIADLYGRIGWQGLTSDEYIEEGAWLVTGTDFSEGKVNWESCVHISERRWEEAWQIKLRNGDLLITKDGTIGKLAIVNDLPGHASLNSGIIRIVGRGNRYDVRFMYYVLMSKIFIEWFKDINVGASTIQHLFQGDFKHFVLPFPCVEEQIQIADALDDLIEQIGNEGQLIEEQIDVLERYRKSVIHKAVTKGLDANVSMKPSGVEWIGDIPEYWETRRIKHVAQTGSGSTPDSSNYDYYDGELSWIQSGDLYGRTRINATERTITSKAMVENQALTIYPAPFVVVAMYGASIGNSALSAIDACTNQACCSLIPGKQLDVPYLSYLLLDAKEDLKAKAIGGTQPNISQVIIKNIKIPLPPLSEQQEIADYLDEKCAKVDAILDIKRKQIEVLKKRRQSLIYEYVTGKRRVEVGV